MKLVGGLAKTVLSPVAGVLSLLTPKAPKLPAPLATPTRDDAAKLIENDDALRKRRGGAADILTGAGGAEAGAAATGKQTLGA